jgi:hypothetical protein
MCIQEFMMKDEHSNSMTGPAEAMTNVETALSVSPPARQSPEQTTRASLPAQNTVTRLSAQNVRGRLVAVSGEGKPRSPSGFSTVPSVELHIEELVLNGFAPGDRYRIGDAVERELTRLFTEHGAPPAITHDLEIAHLNGGAINLKPGAKAETTGIQLARAIYGGLGK